VSDRTVIELIAQAAVFAYVFSPFLVSDRAGQSMPL